jgi:hypothetical protein
MAHAAVAPFKKGEVIRYSVKQAGIKAGEATLEFKGDTYRDGKKYALIVFSSKGFNFRDEENIFLDPETWLPLLVVRDLNIFGSVETIMEEYDQKTGMIKVTKTAKDGTTVRMLDKPGPIDNIYAFIYRYRMNGTFARDEKIDLKLPTLDISMLQVKDVEFNAAGKMYKAALMRSVPSKYSIWMDKGDKRFLLRISGSVGITNTVMTMIGYEE